MNSLKMNFYFGFAIADSMFPDTCTIVKKTISIQDVKNIINNKNNIIPCFNPSHKPTIDVMKNKYGIDLEIPETAPIVKLQLHDNIIVMSVRGLPRLEGRHEYTKEEIDNAEFKFSLYTVKFNI